MSDVYHEDWFQTVVDVKWGGRPFVVVHLTTPVFDNPFYSGRFPGPEPVAPATIQEGLPALYTDMNAEIRLLIPVTKQPPKPSEDVSFDLSFALAATDPVPITAENVTLTFYAWSATVVEVDITDTMWGLKRKDKKPIAGTHTFKATKHASSSITSVIDGQIMDMLIHVGGTSSKLHFAGGLGLDFGTFTILT